MSGLGNPDNDVFYEPSPAKVAVGSTVTWTNDDALPHTVTSGNPEKGSDGIFASRIVNADKSFSYTFDKAGVLDYYCAIHPWDRQDYSTVALFCPSFICPNLKKDVYIQMRQTILERPAIYRR